MTARPTYYNRLAGTTLYADSMPGERPQPLGANSIAAKLSDTPEISVIASPAVALDCATLATTGG